MDVSDASGMLYDQPSTLDEKKALVELENVIIEHPYVANALTRVTAETMTRVATTANLNK